jgi:putative salt-induced outer membrane protein YdiY
MRLRHFCQRLVLGCLLSWWPAAAQVPEAAQEDAPRITPPAGLEFDLPKATPDSTTLPALSWVPPDDGFDWIQLKSGEWLKGRFKGMQDRELDFDSEELDEQTFEWKDIRQLRTYRLVDVLFVDEARVSGRVTATPSEITIVGATPQTFPRDQLQSLTPGGNRERDYWTGKLTFGLTLRGGNTEQTDYTATAELQRRTPATRLRLNYTGNFSSVDGTENVNNQRLASEFNYWISRRFYLVIPYGEYYKDPFQNLAHRLTGSVGVGYDLINRPKVEWNITAGPAYEYAVYESSQPGEPTELDGSALIFRSYFEWDITRKVELSLEYSGQFTSKEIGETTQHSVSTLSIDITKRFDLDVSLTWDRINNPKTGADGIQPEQDDYRLVVALGVDF